MYVHNIIYMSNQRGGNFMSFADNQQRPWFIPRRVSDARIKDELVK